MKHTVKTRLAKIRKRIFVIFPVALILIAALPSVLPRIEKFVAQDLILFENDELKAVLVIRDQADLTDTDYKYISDSAVLIKKHFKDATGYDLPQFTESEFRRSPKGGSFAGKIKIHLGWNGLNPHPDLAQTLIDLNAEADNDGNHGYVFAPNVDNVVIQSPTPLGVRYGAAAFLRKYLDVEWLMPGPYGADTPVRDEIAIPQVLEFSAPVFNMRYAYCGRTPVDWLLNQGLQLYSHTKMGNFSHALCYYFDSDKYFDEHPEYYPIHEGEHYRPDDEIAWQPRFSEPGTIDVAAAEIIALLREDSDLFSVSLGVNDSGGYCERELAEQEAIYGLNSEGLVHMTDLYCKWSNAVIEKVLAEFPGRDIKFGMIAYRNLNDPPKEPGLKFHESMIPYITKDRLAWIDPGQQTQGYRITLDWLERCSQLGWYNYEYGSVYFVPRIYNAQMQKNMQFAQDSGVKYIFSETMFSVDEGPKPHLFAMLNWNPECPLEYLESRWYRKAVGPQAAPHLEAFYRVWEEIWTEDIPKSKWFEDCKNFTYLQFFYCDYLDGIPSQKLQLARQHLDAARTEVQKSGNADQKKRMEAIYGFYALQEATALAYPRSSGYPFWVTGLEAKKDGIFDQEEQMRDKALTAYSALLNEVDPLINRPTVFFGEFLFDLGDYYDSRIDIDDIYSAPRTADDGSAKDRALGFFLIENQSYPEDRAAYNSLDITSYFRSQFQHKYLSFRLSGASESGYNYYLHSHKLPGAEPRVIIKKKDGSKLALNATNGLELRTSDPDANYSDSDYYNERYVLRDSSHDYYNSVLYLIFDLAKYPEANLLDPKTIASVDLEISLFYAGSSPYDPPLIRVTGLRDYPGNSRWSPETITWNSQPEIVLNNNY